MAANEHTVYLMSNSSMDYFPNTISYFQNRLEPPINCAEGEWEVGLVDIFYPYLLEDDIISDSEIADKESDDKKQKKKINTIITRLGSVDFPQNSYSSFEDLYQTIKEAASKQINVNILLQNLQWIVLRDNHELLNMKRSNQRWKPIEDDPRKAANTIAYTSQGQQGVIRFPVKIYRSLEELVTTIRSRLPSLNMAIAVNQMLNSFLSNDLKGVYYPLKTDTEENMFNKEPVYVYVDIIEPQYVGGIKSRVIRSIPFPVPTRYQTFNPITYVKVEKQHIDVITFSLQTMHGERVRFVSTTVPLVATLHFRRRQ